jgi:5'-phosphate synthase pdxT subunit
VWVRSLAELAGITHLIIPGGESGTMEKLLKEFKMWEEILNMKNLKIFGTCAGAILCEKLGADITIDRNAYGAQQESFTTDLNSPKFNNLKGVFIRAPRIEKVGKNVTVLASYKKESVLVEDRNFLIGTFHPEILAETRIHEYFLQKN